MASSYYHKTRYSSQDIEIEYQSDGGSDNFNYPGHICDGGADPVIINIVAVTSDLGDMLFNQRQCERWEADIAENFVPDFDDYDDSYM